MRKPRYVYLVQKQGYHDQLWTNRRDAERCYRSCAVGNWRKMMRIATPTEYWEHLKSQKEAH